MYRIVAPFPFLSSVPGWIRTNDLPLRRRLLYPAGLREQLEGYSNGMDRHNLCQTLPFAFRLGCLKEGHPVIARVGFEPTLY